MSKTEMTRPQFVYEVKDTMKEHSINETQTIQLYAMLHNIEWEIPAEDMLILINKRLVKDGKVNVKVLFRREASKQTVLKFNFNSDPKGTETSLKVAKNLEAQFVPEEWQTEKFIKLTADEYFAGDLTAARYFLIFKSLFPVKDLKRNLKWNRGFKITYKGSTRWSSSYLVPKKFYKFYREKDVGLLLSGLYFAVKDSINFDMHECYMTKPEKFLSDHVQWYELAKERLDKIENGDTKPVKSL